MRRGEIYLVPFAYSDLQNYKRRPACVVSSEGYNGGGRDVVLAMVTSNQARAVNPELGDVVVSDWQAAGLLRPSVVRAGRLLVLEQRLLAQPRGMLTVNDVAAVDRGLRDVLGL